MNNRSYIFLILLLIIMSMGVYILFGGNSTTVKKRTLHVPTQPSPVNGAKASLTPKPLIFTTIQGKIINLEANRFTFEQDNGQRKEIPFATFSTRFVTVNTLPKVPRSQLVTEFNTWISTLQIKYQDITHPEQLYEKPSIVVFSTTNSESNPIIVFVQTSK